MAEVIILAGPSGAGKSSWVENHVAAERVVCSSDHYHMDPETGEYRWRADRAVETHNLCFRKFLRELANAHPTASDGKAILVDNTNTTEGQIAPYIAAARAYGFEPRVVVFVGDGTGIFGRNDHGVPDLVVFAMAERVKNMLLTWPSFWPHPTLVPIQPGPSYRGPTLPVWGKDVDPSME